MSEIYSIFKRYENNPVLRPTDQPWESKAVFNAGAVDVDGEVKLLYRAVGEDNISRFGLATSQDGFNFKRLANPVLEPEHFDKYEVMGIEDPRITLFEGIYNITYVATSLYPPAHPKPTWSPDAPWRVRISLSQTKDFINFEHKGVVLAEQDSKDPALFPERINNKIYLLHRIFPDIWVSIGETWNSWEESRPIIKPRKGMWDDNRIGAGAPPIKTKDGWLLIYHGIDNTVVYRIGAVLLDLNDPTKVIARSDQPFLQPENDYEKSGTVSNAVFSCGMVQRDGKLIIYYGAADRTLCAGTVSLNDLMATLKKV